MSAQAASRLASPTSRSFKQDYAIDYQPHRVVTEIALRGELDLRAMASLEQVIDQARRSSARMIVVDLRELTCIDATALPRFAIAEALCCERAIRLRLLSRGHDRPEPVDHALGPPGRLSRATTPDVEQRRSQDIRPSITTIAQPMDDRPDGRVLECMSGDRPAGLLASQNREESP